jgi:WD40 repeat protein
LSIDTSEVEYSVSVDFDSNEGINVISFGNFSGQFTDTQEIYTIPVDDGETDGIDITLPENLQRRYLYSPILSPNGDLIVAGSYDGLYFWDASTSELISMVTTSDIELISFSEDGKLLLTYGRGAPSVRFWGIPSHLVDE